MLQYADRQRDMWSEGCQIDRQAERKTIHVRQTERNVDPVHAGRLHGARTKKTQGSKQIIGLYMYV